MQPPIYGGWVDFEDLFAVVQNVFIAYPERQLETPKKCLT